MSLTLAFNSRPPVSASRMPEFHAGSIPALEKHSESPFPFTEDSEKLGQEMGMSESYCCQKVRGSHLMSYITREIVDFPFGIVDSFI